MTITGSPILSRGKFVKLSTRIVLSLAGALGLAGLVRYFSYRPQSGPPSIYSLGQVDDFPKSGTLLQLDIPAVVYHTNQGYQAYSLICTHLGCTLEDNGTGFICPCHGSKFSPQGIVIKGPAEADLNPLSVEITDEGELVILHKGGGK
jgi:Rieske Fe-S protein